MLEKTIVKKGNSNYILISKDYLDNLNLKTGDKVQVILKDENSIIIRPSRNKKIKK